MKIERTRRGARIIDDDVVLSEILARPGPTHSLFDVLAAAVAAFAPGPRFAMLGFAGGGMIAPLRAMGCDIPVRAVDLYFKKLVDEYDQPIDDAWRERRKAALMEAYLECQPEVLAGSVVPWVLADR